MSEYKEKNNHIIKRIVKKRLEYDKVYREKKKRRIKRVQKTVL